MTNEERKDTKKSAEDLVENYLKKMSPEQRKLAEAVLLGMTLAQTRPGATG